MRNFLLLFTLGALLTACYPEDPNPVVNPANINFQELGTYDANGVPDYFCERGSEIDNGLETRYFNTFVSKESVIDKHPEWFADSTINNDIQVTEDTDFTITFLTEEADNSNVMGYYIYPTGDPRETANQVDDYYILYPNTTIDGQDVLLEGDKICDLALSGGTSLGLFVAIQGWRNDMVQLTEGLKMVFSNSAYNNIPSNSDQSSQRSLVLYDEATDSYIVTFEALMTSAADNDFDDAAVVIKFSNPNAVDPSGMLRLPAAE